jgi:hypothetical protein
LRIGLLSLERKIINFKLCVSASLREKYIDVDQGNNGASRCKKASRRVSEPRRKEKILNKGS